MSLDEHKSIIWVGCAILLLAIVAWLLTDRATKRPPEKSDGVVVVAGGDVDVSPARPITIAEGSVSLPSQIKTALQVGDAARLRRPVAANEANGIICGEISPSGDPADYRRFVYNGAGRTGGIDDGSPKFREYADKICALKAQP